LVTTEDTEDAERTNGFLRVLAVLGGGDRHERDIVDW
jgi:hypothetical protein